MNSVTGKQNRSKLDDVYAIQREAWILWERIREFTSAEVKHVYAHGGIVPNELADQLADAGRTGVIVNGEAIHPEAYGSLESIIQMHALPRNDECDPRVWFKARE